MEPILRARLPPDAGALRAISLQFGNNHFQYQVPWIQKEHLGDGVIVRIQDGAVQVLCGDFAKEAVDYLFGEGV